MSTFFITQVLPHEDTDDHEVVARCGNIDIMHAPGSIQSFGVLVGLEEPSLTIKYISDNAQRHFGISHQELLGQNLSKLVPSDQFESLRSKLASENFTVINPVKITINNRSFDFVLHRRNGVLFIEAERVSPNAGNLQEYQEMAQRSITNILGTQSVPDLIQVAVDEIRQITGYDRVLFYTFDEQYHGKVVGESRVPDIDSFLGHRFPAWETPGRVRQLYETNSTRYLPHIYDMPSKIMSMDGSETEGALDLTNTILRSTRQCHIEYLTNMGVGASLTFSMRIQGRIWGFIVCHKKRPGEIPFTYRLLCEQVAGSIPDELWKREQPELYKQKLDGILNGVVGALNSAPNIASGLLSNSEQLLTMTRANGAAIYFNNVLKGIGNTPNETELRQLVQIVESSNLTFKDDPQGLIYTNNLTAYLNKSGLAAQAGLGQQIKLTASGVVLIPITNTGKDFFMWFRPEQVTTATWAGNPSKDTIFDEKYMHAPLNPRKSFDTWKANVTNRAEAWLPFEIDAVKSLRDQLLSR